MANIIDDSEMSTGLGALLMAYSLQLFLFAWANRRFENIIEWKMIWKLYDNYWKIIGKLLKVVPIIKLFKEP